MLDRCYRPLGINLLTLNFAPATKLALQPHEVPVAIESARSAQHAQCDVVILHHNALHG